MNTIKIVGSALGNPGPHDGLYLKEFRPDTDALGHGELITTSNAAEAMQFVDAGAALEFWKQQSKRCPFRDDGKPNRPLTAFTIEVEWL